MVLDNVSFYDKKIIIFFCFSLHPMHINMLNRQRNLKGLSVKTLRSENEAFVCFKWRNSTAFLSYCLMKGNQTNQPFRLQTLCFCVKTVLKIYFLYNFIYFYLFLCRWKTNCITIIYYILRAANYCYRHNM